MRKSDVIVFGAGIAGCATSSLLAQQGFNVMMISRDVGSMHHLPESWVYNPSSFLGHTKLDEQLLSTLKKQNHCIFSSADGVETIEITLKNSKKIIDPGDLVKVDRNQFDQILLEHALSSGVTFYPKSTITNCKILEDKVQVLYESQNYSHELTAPIVIDATGKSAFLTQLLKLPVEEKKLDTRIALFTHFEFPFEFSPEMKIVAIDGGYLFIIPVSNNRVSIGCVLAESSANLSIPIEEQFHRAVLQSSYLSNLIDCGKKVLPIIPAKNYQKICLEMSGPCYRLVGDAAAFLDPFFCPGIDFAFFSAKKAVESIVQNNPQSYSIAIRSWLTNEQTSVFNNLEKSSWSAIIKLFADPHLPWQVPLMLTEAFKRTLPENKSSFSDNINLIRNEYANTVH